MDNSIYYKLYNSKEGYLTVLCLQWFDELDYNESRFYKLENEVCKFDSEEEAISYLNLHFCKEDIDPEFYRVKRKL